LILSERFEDEFKTCLRSAQIVLQSKQPELVRQEFYEYVPYASQRACLRAIARKQF